MVLINNDSSTQRVDILTNESHGTQDASSAAAFRRLTVDLPTTGSGSSNDVFSSSVGTIRINQGPSAGALELTLNRTIRVPDNRDTNMLPPSMGQFPLYRVQDYADRMPADMAAKGGLFFPMYQREAMWINFRASRPFALKVYVGGVNAVSGLPRSDGENDTEKTRQKRLRMLKDGKPVQDYMVVPGQPWLDGIASEDGRIRQFIAKPKGSGFSVEAQVTGEEKVGGVQIEVVPIKCGLPRELEVRYENSERGVIKRSLLLADKGLSEDSSVLDLKKLLKEEFNVALEDQIIDTNPWDSDMSSSLNGSESDAGATKLGSLYFKPNGSLTLSHKPKFDEYACDTRACFGTTSAPPPPPPGGAVFGAAAPASFGGALFGAAPSALNPQIVPEVMSLKSGPPGSADKFSMEMEFEQDFSMELEQTSACGKIMPVAARKVVKEMGLAAGGFIQQTIEPDRHPADVWDVDEANLLNLQILDSESFTEVTGLPPPPTPVDAETYAQNGYPFFEIWGEEKTGVKGDFAEVKSVAQIEAERAKERGEEVEEEKSVPQRIHVIGHFRSTFRPVAVLKKELEGLKLDD
ncbi:hypothetical protein PFICI_03813 [Pestalotiopsis fici W106-1]|uniref:Integral membrane protein n=1 Tax=Pestalotiopsis fici (strain W106-1 / CGMCC3.15140) TaxID=1229662 RepID=W3XIA0_PESFW|nr:uncharacterized protein PFICI_03813 [Pestalotiopsis fici W106-1]ETS85788.1 hypothetical protein PFICI_03813 [Pestalotiopsis fici W106-1]